MTVSVFAAAKFLGQESGWSLSNLQLQKIIYLTHMLHLGKTGEPLVYGHFEAWYYGPVHPDLYHRVKVFGADPVRNLFHDIADIPDGREKEMLRTALKRLSGVAPGRLVGATHREEGAWAKYYEPGQRNFTIPNEEILAEYRGLPNAA